MNSAALTPFKNTAKVITQKGPKVCCTITITLVSQLRSDVKKGITSNLWQYQGYNQRESKRRSKIYLSQGLWNNINGCTWKSDKPAANFEMSWETFCVKSTVPEFVQRWICWALQRIGKDHPLYWQIFLHLLELNGKIGTSIGSTGRRKSMWAVAARDYYSQFDMTSPVQVQPRLERTISVKLQCSSWLTSQG